MCKNNILNKNTLYPLTVYMYEKCVFSYYITLLCIFQVVGERKEIKMITMIRKRDGREVPFNIEKIANAIYKAAEVLGGQDYYTAMKLACEVAERIEEESKSLGIMPTVERIQDMVETVLIDNGHARTAKEFILYRAERTRLREMNTKLMKTYESIFF